jgi:hypothetical protein
VFKELLGRLKGTIDETGKELAVSLRDIERYEETLDQIASEGGAAELAEPAEPAELAEPAAPVAPVAVVPPVAAVAPVAAPVASKAAPTKEALDEMAFIRSMTGVMAPTKIPPRPLGKAALPPEPPARAAANEPEREEPRFAEPPEVALDEPPVGVTAVPAEVRGSTSEAVASRRSEETRTAHGEGKALVCGECGAPNLPTEWYCEKCGAELSAF